MDKNISEMEENSAAKGEFLIYQTDDGQIKIEVRLEDETIWLTQPAMAELFYTTQQNISQHILNVYEEGELVEEATNKKFLLVRQEGSRQVKRSIDYYNLDMIISVGYRIKSRIATRFRIWATQQLKEYIIKGFVIDDERLKNPLVKGSPIPDYFDEMLARIRDIRSSERRMYLRVKEIFSMAADYEPSADDTARFFSTIQNKLHYAAAGMTAAELINSRANAQLPNMGLTSWQRDEVRITDITVAKNYLKEDEISRLNRIVTMWLDFAEDQAERRSRVFMNDWERKLDEFLRFNDREVLAGAGHITKKTADGHARQEYEKFTAMRREQKEIEGAKDYLKQLEAAAKALPKLQGNGK